MLRPCQQFDCSTACPTLTAYAVTVLNYLFKISEHVGCLGGSVMIWWFVGSSPTLGSVLTPQSLEPASDSVSSPLSVPPLLALALSLYLSEINVKKIFLKNFHMKQTKIKNRKKPN